MSFDFTVKEFILGNGTGASPLQFYKYGFDLGSTSESPSYQDIVLSGNGSLTLTNAKAHGLNYLKLFGGTEQRNFPEGYTQLEYIESTGTQYIDLDVSGDATFIGTAQSTTDSSTTSQVLVANSGASAGHWFGVQSPSAGSSFAKKWGLGATQTASSTIEGTTKVDFEVTFTQSSQYGTVNDQVLDRNSSTSAHTNWVVFAGNTTPLYGFIGKVWGLKVVQNNVLVRNFVPCKNSSDVVGIYDLVSGQFFTNAGTGDFVAGSAVVPTPDYPMDIVCNNGVIKARHQSGLPTGYTQLEYIKSNRNIPLGFYTNQNSEIEAKWYKDGAGAQYVYQANSGSALTNNTTAYATEGGGNWRFGDQTISITALLYIDITSIQNKNGVWFNNERQGTYTNINDFTGDIEFKALGIPTTGYSQMIRLSYIKHRQNGVLLGYYVPCVAPDNSIGLYDLIGGVFYTNADATITAGNPVSDPIEIYTDGTVETVEVTGKNLYDGTYVDGYYIASNGTVTQGAPGINAYSTAIKVIEGNIYTFSGVAGYTSSSNRVHGYSGTSTTDWVQQIDVFSTTDGVSYSDTFTIPNGVSYIRISQTLSLNSNVQLELGATATTYEPYFNGGSATAEMLLKVGDYKDEQNVTNGHITRNVGAMVFDGSENWVSAGTGSSLRCHITYDIGLPDTDTLTSPMICSHYQFGGYISGGGATTQGTFNAFSRRAEGDEAYYLRFSIVGMGISSASGFKQWLKAQYNAGTPVTIVYPLATATTETVTGQTLTTQSGSNTITITQASIDNLPLEVSYKGTV